MNYQGIYVHRGNDLQALEIFIAGVPNHLEALLFDTRGTNSLIQALLLLQRHCQYI